MEEGIGNKVETFLLLTPYAFNPKPYSVLFTSSIS